MRRCGVCGSPLDETPCPRCDGRIRRKDLLGPPRRRGFLAEFAIGLALAARGARMTLTTPRLLALAVLPFFLTIVLFVALFWLISEHDDVFFPDWLFTHTGVFADFVAGLFSVLLSALLTYVISSIASAPFLEWTSECVETIVFDHKDERRITPHYVWNVWIVPLFQSAGLALVQGAVGLVMLVLSLTGILAPVVFAGGVFLVAVTLCDIVIARKRYPVLDRFRFVIRDLPLYAGVALPFALVPFLLPFGVAGATLAFLRQQNIAPSRSS